MKKNNQWIDEHTWNEFKQGNEEAFKVIYTKHYTVLFNYGLKLVQEPDRSEDAVQELFLRLWKNRAHLGGIKSPKAYLFKSLRGILIDYNRKDQSKKRLADHTHFEDINLSVEDIVINDEISHERKTRLQQCLDQLSNRQKEVIYLKFYDGLSYNEISEILEINNQSVRNNVYEAIKALKKHLLSCSLALTYLLST